MKQSITNELKLLLQMKENTVQILKLNHLTINNQTLFVLVIK